MHQYPYIYYNTRPYYTVPYPLRSLYAVKFPGSPLHPNVTRPWPSLLAFFPRHPWESEWTITMVFNGFELSLQSWLLISSWLSFLP